MGTNYSIVNSVNIDLNTYFDMQKVFQFHPVLYKKQNSFYECPSFADAKDMTYNINDTLMKSS